MGQNPVRQAVETLSRFYKQREMNLAKELVNKFQYHSGDLARIQNITRQSAFSYYRSILKKGGK